MSAGIYAATVVDPPRPLVHRAPPHGGRERQEINLSTRSKVRTDFQTPPPHPAQNFTE